MQSLWILAVLVISVQGDEITQPTITSTTQPTEKMEELQTEETRTLRKPENSTLPANHSEILRAMPTEESKTEQPSPSQSQSQQIVKISPGSVLNITAVTDVGKYKDFRPSPQLEPIYEYNHFPVVPAHPEAKHFLGTSIKIPIHSTLSHALGDSEGEKDTSWSSKVRFPHTHPITVNDHPYPYLKDAGIDKGLTTGYGSYQKDSGLFKRPIMHKYGSYGDGWDKTLKKKFPSKTYHEEGSGFNTDLSSSPWKKIIKILTAFIPIGLLLSALTPSIITIGPMNGTTARARSNEKPKNGLLSQFSLDGCDERIFCELMLSASESGNNDKNIETMLENYVESHGNSTRLQLIYKAIKTGNCSSLHCNSIKD